eukprot:765986-Hanusia_phi.AAC.3
MYNEIAPQQYSDGKTVAALAAVKNWVVVLSGKQKSMRTKVVSETSPDSDDPCNYMEHDDILLSVRWLANIQTAQQTQ